MGNFNNLEFDDDALVPPLDERLLPLPLLPLFFEGKDEMRENTEEVGGVKGGLLEELCLLSEKEEKKGVLSSHTETILMLSFTPLTFFLYWLRSSLATHRAQKIQASL